MLISQGHIMHFFVSLYDDETIFENFGHIRFYNVVACGEDISKARLWKTVID